MIPFLWNLFSRLYSYNILHIQHTKEPLEMMFIAYYHKGLFMMKNRYERFEEIGLEYC